MESILDLVLRLLGGDEELTNAYHADPAAFADKYFGDLCGADWNDLNLALDQTGIFTHNFDTGGNVVNQGNGVEQGITAKETGHYGHQGHHGDHAAAQLQNIVNNYSQIDDRDTITDQSVNQVISTGGGDFWQRIDNDSTTASGDGAVAAGDDINGDVSTIGHGDGNVGAGNVVGEDNDGNAVGEDSTVDNDPDNSLVIIDVDDSDTSTVSETENSFNSGSEDSFNKADDSFNDADDSFNNNSINNSIVSDDDGVDDDSSTTQNGLINVNDVLSHNNIPVDVDILNGVL